MSTEPRPWWGSSRHEHDAEPHEQPQQPRVGNDGYIRADRDRTGAAAHDADPSPQGAPEPHQTEPPAAHAAWRHRLLMLVCCIPMLIVVIALVASGVAGAGAIIFALLCVAMMAVMMFMMPGDHRH